MATTIEETPTESPWYGKFFEYWRNRNRISPDRIELPDCDFFIVAPRRTLRVLRPSLKDGWYYENTLERPESINDNFFNRWSRRPHPSGNCRCSFRQSSSAMNTTEKQIISAKLNRIRTSLCEAEKNARNIEELEQRVSINLRKLQRNSLTNHVGETTETSIPVTTDSQSLKPDVKHQIVKDLERYINTLLEEILDDTIKYVTEAEKNGFRHSDISVERANSHLDKSQLEKIENPSFLTDEREKQWSIENECRELFTKVSMNQGYVNRAFVSSTDGLASIELDHSLDKHGISSESIVPEQLDCVDSGINSVETIEFQPDQEPSFEQSLLQIIDEKLGRASSTNYSVDNLVRNSQANPEEHWTNSRKIVQTSFELDTLTNDADSHRTVEQFVNANVETNFEELWLKAEDNDKHSSLNDNTLSNIDAEIMETSLTELKDYKKEWSDEISLQNNIETRSPCDSVTLRKNRKPTIVFLHGFGSSAEIFEHQLRYFSSLGYPCIAPDMLGHGMSSAPGQSRDYHFNKLLKDFDAVLQHYAFKPGEKCVLVAHNYGCSFATALAYKYDSNIHQLILISGGGPTPLAPPSTESARHCCLRAIFAPFLMCGLHRNILYSARGRQHPYCGHESMEQWPSHMKYVLDGMTWPEGDYVFHRRICTPTLLVHGLRDNKVSLVHECQMERTMMKAFLEAIPMAGHSPMTDCPQQLNHMIHCFIDLWRNKKWQ